MELEKYEYISNLLNCYESLLTEKQVLIMNYHYEEDLSLGEISEIVGTSRQAVHDAVKKSEAALIEYENKLKLFSIQNKLRSLISKIEKLNISDKEKQELIKFCEEISE